MVVALAGDPPVINSGITTDISSSHIGGQVYSTIVGLDKDGNPIPSLAKSWDISEDGKTYTFHLFDGISWHDGEPFSAEDIAWSLWNINREYNGPSSGLLGSVTSIEATDDTTVVFTLDAPYPPLLRGLAYFNSSVILPKHIFDNGGDPRQNPANLKPVGTGPFKFVEYVKGSHVLLEKNEDYHLDGLPHMDRLVFQIIPNASARSIALQNGEVDFLPYYATPLGEVESLRGAEDVTVTYQKRFIAGEYMVFLNTREGPLAEKAVRQALYHAIDREELLEKAGFGFGTVSYGPISSQQPAFFSDDVPTYAYDPEQAKAMLDAAGFAADADGTRFPLRVSFDLKDGPMSDVARLMRSYLAEVGIDLEIEGMDSGRMAPDRLWRMGFRHDHGQLLHRPRPGHRHRAALCLPQYPETDGAQCLGLLQPRARRRFRRGGQRDRRDQTRRALCTGAGDPRRGRAAYLALGPFLSDRLSRRSGRHRHRCDRLRRARRGRMGRVTRRHPG